MVVRLKIRSGFHHVRLGAAIFGVGAALAAAPAQAGFSYIGGSSVTVYGVTGYGGLPQMAPSFIFNNVTGFNDVLASPGGGFLTAAPIVANNIFETGLVNAPSNSSQVGGGNGNGAFGSGRTRIDGTRLTFNLADAALCCSASYIVSSWTSDLLVTPGGLGGDPLILLAIGGTVPEASSAVAAALVSHYYINNVYQGTLAPLILAQARNGNFQAMGNLYASITMDGAGTFGGVAFNSIPGFAAAAGDIVRVTSTFTAFADPGEMDFWPGEIIHDFPPGQEPPEWRKRMILLTTGGVPEPQTWALLIAGFGLVGAIARRQRARLTA